MPFIAIQLQALKIDNWIILVFTKVLDELSRGLVDEDEDVNVTPANRAFWIEKARIETVELMDAMLQKIIAFDSTSTWELNYTKYHVGIKKNGQVNNFVQFKPTMSRLNLSLKLPQTDEIDKKIDDAGLALISYDRWGKYNLSLTDDDIKKKSDLLSELSESAYKRNIFKIKSAKVRICCDRAHQRNWRELLSTCSNREYFSSCKTQ